ncbi:hypothetical protein CLOM_g19923 [Closterium sp. NIES-68]|nr:hypothetical protein CLOM_g19923 [Closterium sp. NIES-68]GJP79683.1 hypothetical protein CLOP_g9884 [Closterium sp. NIES-67]
MASRDSASVSAYLREFCQYLASSNVWPRTRPALGAAHQQFCQSSATNDNTRRSVTLPNQLVLFLLAKHSLVVYLQDTVTWRERSGAPASARSPVPLPAKAPVSQDRRCGICDVTCPNPWQLQQHLNGFRHRNAVRKSQSKGKFHCTTCEILFDSVHQLEVHCSSDKTHKARAAARKLREQRDYVQRGKFGIDISHPFASLLGTPSQPQVPSAASAVGAVRAPGSSVARGADTQPIKMDLGSTLECLVTITNRHQTQRLVSCKLAAENPDIKFGFSGYVIGTDEAVPRSGMEIRPRVAYQLTLRVKPSSVGVLKAILVFSFENFLIGRYLNILVEDQVTKSMAPTAPFEPKDRKSRQEEEPAAEILPGVEPEGWKRAGEQLAKIPWFGIPSWVRESYEGMNTAEMRLPGFEGPVTLDTYKKRFELLLHVEELQMEFDIRYYDMKGVTLLPAGVDHFQLTVPGLAEKRPSVLFGDRVYLSYANEGGDGGGGGHRRIEYQGFVHGVDRESALLRFHPDFHRRFIRGQQFNVRFEVPRGPTRACHLALGLANQHLGQHVLMPSQIPQRIFSIEIPAIRPFDRQLNVEQKEAVAQVLVRSRLQLGARPEPYLPPYIVFGPPGTGKTKTVVEAILQVVRALPSARVLVCAPSNSATDNIALRLKGTLQVREMLRLYSVSRGRGEVESDLLPFTRYDDSTGVFRLPTLSEIHAARVVAVTCCSAALLYRMGVPRGTFTHIFIDEAGHAIEPEGIIPIACHATPHAVILLAGDHKQLGPVVRSLAARRYKLQCSYLERMANLGIYSPEDSEGGGGGFIGYNTSAITKLVKNYRSHPKILELPNEMFYEGELEACADEMARSSLCRWDELPNKKEFPIFFHGVMGRDEREGSSPSFFNPTEASVVIKYITSLMGYRSQRVPLTDIGVVTPYRKQMQKLQVQLKGKGMGAVKVGSVEEFQGQERRVVIVSTVRSSQQYVEFDYKHNLGFLANPKRFNVAVTRAKQLLIIVGNPNLLAQDRCWGALLQFCRRNNAYTGCPLPATIPPPDLPSDSPLDGPSGPQPGRPLGSRPVTSTTTRATTTTASSTTGTSSSTFATQSLLDSLASMSLNDDDNADSAGAESARLVGSGFSAAATHEDLEWRVEA